MGVPRIRIAIHSQDLDANYDANFLSVFRVDGTALVKEVVLDGDSDKDGMWGPGKVEWKSALRISFSRVKHSPDGPEYISEPWLLEMENGAWKAKLAN